METQPPKNNKRATFDLIGTVARWLLGGLFIYMGLQKATHPEAFLKLVRPYEMVTSPVLLDSIAAALPWFEIFCGLLLVLGIAVRGTALNLLLMLVPFTLIVLRRALTMSEEQHLSFSQIKFDCGCGTGEVFIWKKMLENIGLMLAAVLVLAGYGKRFCLKHTLLSSSPNQAKKITRPVKSLAAQS